MAKEEKAAAPAAPPTIPVKKVDEYESWQKFATNHQPVAYSEMVERWGGEQRLWDAYADGKMERGEAEYLEGAQVWGPGRAAQAIFTAKAFSRVVLPRLKAMAEEIEQLRDLVLSGPATGTPK